MKHIGFDESTVLGEYARIASEQGFIKVAAENPLLAETQRLNQLFADLMKKYDNLDKVRPLYELEVAKSVAGLKKRFGDHPEIAKFEQEVRKMGVSEKEGITDVITPSASKESELSKSAEGKLYDVSGETGEQLIDSAHPGGGTRTELTHSKTDENLVETIVEQQKRDIEVAQRVPKGTYAALKDLHTKLEKLGVNTKQLNKLSNIIDLVYTPEEFIYYKLAKLSDDLDAIGSHSAADKVDNLIILAADPLSDIIPNVVTKFPAGAGGGAGRAPGAIMSRLGPAAGGLGAAALPWLGVAGAAAGVGLAGYFLYKELRAAENTLDGLIDRLEDLDPNENAKGSVQGWISTFQQMKSKMVIPQASPDADTQKQIVQQRASDLQEVASQLTSLQQQWPQIEPNLTDMFFDKGQAKKVLDQTSARIGQLAQQAAAKLPQVEEAAEAQKKEEAKGTSGKGVPKPESKPKGSWRQRVVTDFGTAYKFSHWYNKIIGAAGEHRTAIRVSDEARVSKTVTPQMREDIEKALARINEAGGGKEWAKQMKEEKGTAGKGEPKAPAPPSLPEAPEGKDVAKEQMINKMYDAAARGLSGRGYPVEDMKDEVMRIIRKHSDSRFFDVANPRGAQRIWNVIRDEINESFPKRR